MVYVAVGFRYMLFRGSRRVFALLVHIGCLRLHLQTCYANDLHTSYGSSEGRSWEALCLAG